MKEARPRCVEVSTSKTGKHGHAKAHIVAIDIFTGRALGLGSCGSVQTTRQGPRDSEGTRVELYCILCILMLYN